ncbi:uncharacterized protein [Anoplolepis gracilipes]|uniref:uncharacterized protein n=1 Tax=Anoplolepis gracilipes TaxID=354296 RepID=UPI003BA126E1
MPYYGVANGRNTGVYDNWEDCKKQVEGYSYNEYKKFNTPSEAWDFVDERSSTFNGNKYVNNSNDNAIACRGGNQIALRNNYEGISSYQRTDYMEGKNGVVVRERTYKSGRHGNGYFVEKRTLTYWEN